MIYLLRAGTIDPQIKIGWVADPTTIHDRIRTLQTGNPNPIALVATLPGDRARESQLHRQFAHLRIQGEWFRSDPAIYATFNQEALSMPVANPTQTPPPTFQTLDPGNSAKILRVPTGLPPLDAVMGGGFPLQTTTLVHGDPGAGKSTLMLQLAAWVALNAPSHPFPAAYVTAEEGAAQIQARAARLGLAAARVALLETDDLPAAITLLDQRPIPPLITVFDSVQRLRDPQLRALPGTPTQTARAAQLVVAYVRRQPTVALLICHETKGSRAAGPMALQHDVDAALALTQPRVIPLHPHTRQQTQDNPALRLLTVSKNRGGPTDVSGRLLMTAAGFVPVRP